jgi:hypothetical protein
MDSTGLGQMKKDFESWYSFNQQRGEEAPRKKGVYVIRQVTGKSFGRLQGQSDILYIGSTTSRGGLRQRLIQYFHPGPTQWTNRRINEFLKKYQMEVAWCPCNEPVNLEHRLLRQYLDDHNELPPFNHTGIRRVLTSAATNI